MTVACCLVPNAFLLRIDMLVHLGCFRVGCLQGELNTVINLALYLLVNFCQPLLVGDLPLSQLRSEEFQRIAFLPLLLFLFRAQV